VTNKEMVGSLVFRGRAKVAFARWRSPVIGRLGADSSVDQFFWQAKPSEVNRNDAEVDRYNLLSQF
jgi:hypothetical protein